MGPMTVASATLGLNLVLLTAVAAHPGSAAPPYQGKLPLARFKSFARGLRAIAGHCTATVCLDKKKKKEKTVAPGSSQVRSTSCCCRTPTKTPGSLSRTLMSVTSSATERAPPLFPGRCACAPPPTPRAPFNKKKRTRNRYETIFECLVANASRAFNVAEINFFSHWFDAKNASTQARVREMVRAGQYGFNEGGWVQPDEGATNYLGAPPASHRAARAGAQRKTPPCVRIVRHALTAR